MDRAQIVPRGMIHGGTDLPQCSDRGLRPACVRHRHRRWRMSAFGCKLEVQIRFTRNLEIDLRHRGHHSRVGQ
jgi:hypothetical protein